MKARVYGCGLEAALAVGGGKWRPLILYHLAHGRLRFGEIRKIVVGISEKVLIHELKQMTLDGMTIRKDFHEMPPRVEYSLTAFGMEFADMLRPLCDWGATNMDRIGRLPTQTVG